MTSHLASRTQEVPPSASRSLYKAVAAAVYTLGSSLDKETSMGTSVARATLSRLRQAAGTDPGSDPIAWGLVVEELLHNLPEHEIGKTDEPSNGEWAAFTALTMFAVHQRSQPSFMHRKNQSVGRAVGELKTASQSQSIKSRLDALQLAASKRAVQYHLRSIISLLNSYDIPLDYGLLAQDLKKLVNPRQRAGVVINWGRDYVRAQHSAS